MTKIRDIAPYSVRMPDSLKKDLMARASRNGRSLNSEIVMILQSAISEDYNPESVQLFAQKEADKFKEALLETIANMHDKDKK